MTYGSAYRDQIVDKLRKAAEHCDCLQCFFLVHSMGGGEAHEDELMQAEDICNFLQSFKVAMETGLGVTAGSKHLDVCLEVRVLAWAAEC